MSRRTQGILIGAVGLAALRLGLTTDLVFFVRERMRIPIVLAGVVLVAVGVLTAWPRHTPNAVGHAPRAAWLLLVPVAALVAFTPRPLGADAFGSQTVARYDPGAQYGRLPSATQGVVELTLLEFWERANFDSKHSVHDRPIRVVAFAAFDGTSTRLGRYLISCCAADALLLSVDVASWPAQRPGNGQWFEAVIRQHGPPTKGETVHVDVISAIAVDQPPEPYLVP